MESKPKIVVIVGPTASGKTGLAIELAKQFNGEVISADSRQVYRELNIGTEKVTPEEMQGVPHHLINIVEPTQVYTAADFKRDAAAAITDITTRGKLPIIAGGTFFYIDILLGKISSPEVPPNEELRATLETKTATELHKQLQELDPRRAADIEKENPRRLMRAIEIVAALGSVPQSEVKPPTECLYDELIIGIETDREVLRARLRSRASNAIGRGVIDETKNLLRQGVTKERLSEIGLEYREVFAYLEGKLNDQELLDRFDQVNWQYSKRQLTWLKRDPLINWFQRTETEHITQAVRDFLS